MVNNSISDNSISRIYYICDWINNYTGISNINSKFCSSTGFIIITFFSIGNYNCVISSIQTGKGNLTSNTSIHTISDFIALTILNNNTYSSFINDSVCYNNVSRINNTINRINHNTGISNINSKFCSSTGFIVVSFLSIDDCNCVISSIQTGNTNFTILNNNTISDFITFTILNNNTYSSFINDSVSNNNIIRICYIINRFNSYTGISNINSKFCSSTGFIIITFFSIGNCN